MTDDATHFFWNLAEQFLDREGVVRGTIFGFPCLRVDGEFFACPEHRTGDLIVKIPAARVAELISDDLGMDFAPAGRKFREWVRIPDRDAAHWLRLMEEALEFVSD